MNKIYAIALNTLRESLRGKILFATLFFAILVVTASAIFSSVTIGDHVKIIKDFGLFALSFFTVLYIVISGGTLLYKELDKKTIHNILSKSVARSEFIFGKFFGMFFTASILCTLMGSALVLYCFLLEGHLDPALLQTFPLIILQIFIICACTIFFSAITVTPLLSGTFAFTAFVIGRSADYLLSFTQSHKPEFIPESLIMVCYWLIPHLDRLDISNQAVYGHLVNFEFIFYSTAYAISYSLVVISVSIIFFSRREFN